MDRTPHISDVLTHRRLLRLFLGYNANAEDEGDCETRDEPCEASTIDRRDHSPTAMIHRRCPPQRRLREAPTIDRPDRNPSARLFQLCATQDGFHEVTTVERLHDAATRPYHWALALGMFLLGGALALLALTARSW